MASAGISEGGYAYASPDLEEESLYFRHDYEQEYSRARMQAGGVKGNGVPLDGAKSWSDLLSYHYNKIASGIFKLRSTEIPYYVKAVSFYWELTPVKYLPMLSTWLRDFGLIPYNKDDTETFLRETSQGHIVDRAKILTEFVLKWRAVIGDGFERLLSLNDGLLPWVDVRNADVAALYDALVQDYGTDVVTNNSSEYIDSFKKYTKQWLSPGGKAVFKDMLSFYDFVDNPANWATPGATIEKGIRYWNGTNWVTSKKTKWSIGMRLDTKQLVQLALESSISKASLSIKKKENPPKLRPVSKESIGNYLCQAYAAYFVEKARKQLAFGTSYESPLSNSTSQNVQRYQDWVHWLQDDTPAVDLDAKQFDLNYSFEENQAWFESILEIAIEQSWPHLEDIRKCVEAIILRAKHTQLTYVHTKQTIPYKRGLLTGKRTTSLQGTCKSSVVVNMVLDLKKIRANLVHASTNGDDTNVFLDSKYAVDEFFKGVTELNAIIVHPTKTLVSPLKDRNGMEYNSVEYLKVLYSSRPWKIDELSVYARGVPVRSIKSLLLRSPESDEKTRTPSAMVANWIRCINRGLDVNRVKKHMLTDLARYFKPKFATLKEAYESTKLWLGTPLSIGGAGLEDLFGQPEYNVVLKGDESVIDSVELKVLQTRVELSKTWLKWGLTGLDVVTELPTLFNINKPKDQTLSEFSMTALDDFSGGNSLNYSVIPNQKVGRMNSFLINKWCRENKSDWRSKIHLLKDIVDDKTYLTIIDIRNRWTRSAFFDWLKGTLWGTQIVIGYSGLQLADYSEQYKRAAFGSLVMLKTNASTLYRARQWVNSRTKSIVNSSIYPQPF